MSHHVLSILLVIFFVSSAASVPVMSIGRCPVPVPSPSSEEWLSQSSTAQEPFVLASGTGSPEQSTVAYSCFNDTHVFFKMLTQGGSPNSTFTQCNDPIYKMDAVELFLTFPGRDVDLHQYLEFEISPRGVLFYANIKNVYLNCTETYPDKRTCATSNVHWTAGVESNHWWAYLSVPWSTLGIAGGYPEMKQQGYLWRANFYRIQLLPSGLRQFSCWSPTMSDPPCFHKPNYFGYLKLQDSR